jgi:tripartite-type tricarboxylate transporter receptor subunit TctC
VPGATPPEIVRKLNREFNAAVTSPKIKAQLADLGSTPMVNSPEQFWTFTKAEIEKWERVIRLSGTKVD